MIFAVIYRAKISKEIFLLPKVMVPFHIRTLLEDFLHCYFTRVGLEITLRLSA